MTLQHTSKNIWTTLKNDHEALEKCMGEQLEKRMPLLNGSWSLLLDTWYSRSQGHFLKHPADDT